MRVVAFLAVNIVSKYGYHILVSVGIEMMHLVSFVDDISHHVGGWCIDDG